ncbi:TetR/AcrR family transcriptional regulator C-terminal domain-containing protein [Chelativorans sp. M5D2P16]|uniref:TetR/AcrR family transcriptional regulator C-terminal domain-containing protein n=1 Tax=Chelativorans sp. M5D2P16 TaxID=3095678 RepID=UPI002ACA5AFF|nr:TetR/AcrR family transcriptional regulator C-terminal domain-containing protein [Chelativorans sp. M5D2P16]MDZ5698272.1 TetR/AcrR family transcriptional regulator C-terminal domain-containing protein [Chelativorans sp. M5D2P16]
MSEKRGKEYCVAHRAIHRLHRLDCNAGVRLVQSPHRRADPGAAAGREAVFPLIETLVQSGLKAGKVAAPSAQTATEWFLSLLIGDQQIRRAIRAMPLPSEKEIRSRAAAATSAFRKLCAA